jgi:hypothetical protein
MLHKTMFLALAVSAAVLVNASEAHGWGACHYGYTHVGYGGVQHYGYTAARGPYGGMYGGAHYGSTGYGSAHYGYSAYGGAHYGYGGAYGGYHAYTPSYGGGYAAGGYHYGGAYGAGAYRTW